MQRSRLHGKLAPNRPIIPRRSNNNAKDLDNVSRNSTNSSWGAKRSGTFNSAPSSSMVHGSFVPNRAPICSEISVPPDEGSREIGDDGERRGVRFRWSVIFRYVRIMIMEETFPLHRSSR